MGNTNRLKHVDGHGEDHSPIAAMGKADRIGDYLLLGFLAEGGMGAVYVAWHPELDHWAALKLPSTELVAGGAHLALFRNEAQTLALLDHPNITRVYAGGVDNGQPYHAMELLNNGNLQEDEHRKRYRNPDAAIRLVLKLAEAVRYAQERGVLHCDIKAANILFDDELEPHLGDFGLASRIDLNGNPVGAALRGGTPGWMAPEQLAPELPASELATLVATETEPASTTSRGSEGAPRADSPRIEALSQAVDVFSLGVLLFWLVEGVLPFGDGSDFAERVRTQPRRAPGRWTPGVNWAVQAVCFKALQVSPRDRYSSAASLVEDLKRGLRGLPLVACSTPSWGRMWLWGARHRALSLAACLLLLLALVSAKLANEALSEQEQALRRDVLEANAFAATGQAAAVLYQLREYADQVLAIAAEVEVQELALSTSPAGPPLAPELSQPGACTQQTALADPAILIRLRGDLEMLTVLNTAGCGRARLPPVPPGYTALNFGWRDYFRGAKSLGALGEHRVYMAQVFHSAVSEDIRFSLSTPLFHRNTWVGVLAAGITVGPAWANHALSGAPNDDRVTVLIGPFDGTRSTTGKFPPGTETEYAILAHPALQRGALELVAPRYAKQISEAFGARLGSGTQFQLPEQPPVTVREYEDPFWGGRWLGAFAPVGSTGYVVLVQTREDAAVRTSAVLLRRLIHAFFALGAAALVTFIAFAVWAARQARSVS